MTPLFLTHTHTQKKKHSLSLFPLSPSLPLWKKKKKKDQLTLLLPTPLEAHHSATLRLRFSYGLPDALEGLYRSTWTEEEEEKDDAKKPRSVLRAAAVTQFEANSARVAFPCFDEPALRAPFAVSLVADEGLTAISNMPEVSVEEEEIPKNDEASSESRRRSRRKKKKKAAKNAPPFPPPPSTSSSSPRPRRIRHVFEPIPAQPSYLVAVVILSFFSLSLSFFLSLSSLFFLSLSSLFFLSLSLPPPSVPPNPNPITLLFFSLSLCSP